MIEKKIPEFDNAAAYAYISATRHLIRPCDATYIRQECLKRYGIQLKPKPVNFMLKGQKKTGTTTNERVYAINIRPEIYVLYVELMEKRVAAAKSVNISAK